METTKFLDLCRFNHSLDSCNGLIFLGGMHNYYHYYVGNPILNQWTLLPPTPKQDIYVATGFAFDGIQGHHYKILHLFYRETTAPLTNTIHCHVFSSETGHWREHHAPIFNSFTTLSHCIKLIRGSSIKQQGVYRNGALHWTFACDHKYMLVFYVEKEVFRFIQLPGGGYDQHRVRKCLWESKGFLHYAVSGGYNRYKVWKNMNGGDVDDKQHRWVHIQTVKYNLWENLRYVRENLKNPKVLICIYDGCWRSLNRKITSIFCVPKELRGDSINLGTILTYLSTINDVLDESSAKTLSWRYMRKNGGGISRGKLRGTLHPYVYNLVDLPLWDGCTLLKHPN